MISWFFRIILILASVGTATFIIKKIRQSRLQIEYTVFWLVFAVMIVLLSVFPEVAIYGASLLGIYDPTNFIFLIIIFLMIVKMFFMTIEISNLEYRLKELVQKTAISEAQKEEDTNKKELE